MARSGSCQIVRGHVGELLQFDVALVQLFGVLFQLVLNLLLLGEESRIAAEVKMPSSVSSGLRLISTGNSLPSFRKP